jgi:hypothetical protein
LFAGLGQLRAVEFLSAKSYRTRQGGGGVKAFLAVVGGAGLMAGVGAFA